MPSADKKLVSNFSNKPLERNFILEINQHITFLKVVENLMMLYIGMAVVRSSFYLISFSFLNASLVDCIRIVGNSSIVVSSFSMFVAKK